MTQQNIARTLVFFIGMSFCLPCALFSDPNTLPSVDPEQYYLAQADRDGRPPLRTNWDFKESWRYDKDVFFRGAPQTQAYQRNFQNRSTPGIGDPNDPQDYWPYYWYEDQSRTDQTYPGGPYYYDSQEGYNRTPRSYERKRSYERR